MIITWQGNPLLPAQPQAGWDTQFHTPRQTVVALSTTGLGSDSAETDN